MGYPVFASGDVLNASDMNAVGLWHLRTQTVGAGVSSVTVNNAFSADYDNYRIVVSGISCSVGGVSLAFQLNNSTGNTYFIGGIFTAFTTTTLNGYGPAASNRWTDAFALDTSTQGASMDLYLPNAARPTIFTSQSVRTGTGQFAWYVMNGIDTNAVASTGFTISPIVGTITGGTIRVYGYRN